MSSSPAEECRSPVGLDCCSCCLDLANRSGLEEGAGGENNNLGSPTVSSFRQLQEQLVHKNLNTDKLSSIMRQDSLEPVVRDPCYLFNQGICNRNIDQTLLSILLLFHRWVLLADPEGLPMHWTPLEPGLGWLCARELVAGSAGARFGACSTLSRQGQEELCDSGAKLPRQIPAMQPGGLVESSELLLLPLGCDVEPQRHLGWIDPTASEGFQIMEAHAKCLCPDPSLSAGTRAVLIASYCLSAGLSQPMAQQASLSIPAPVIGLFVCFLQDLVKNHLMYAVREEVEVLKEQIKELLEKNSQLERENSLLKTLASPEQLEKFQSRLPTEVLCPEEQSPGAPAPAQHAGGSAV
nr:uncharacterized protein LOC112987762 [Dromaius novaehollandiae]